MYLAFQIINLSQYMKSTTRMPLDRMLTIQTIEPFLFRGNITGQHDWQVESLTGQIPTQTIILSPESPI